MAEPPDTESRNTVNQRATRSQRRLTFWRRALYHVAVPIGLCIIRVWWMTCRVARVVGEEQLRDYYQALTQHHVSPMITPDGPRGPAFAFKPGAILLSQMSGRPIVPMACSATRAWLVKWDRFVIPVPLSRIAIAIGAPRQVPRTLDAAGLDRWQREMEAELKSLFETARAALRRP